MSLSALNISHGFGAREVLRNLSVEFPWPSSVAIMGPSGSGKSTLLGILAGHIRPDAGSVSWRGERAMTVEWIVQNSPLLSRRSVLDNIALGGLARGLVAEAAWARAVGTAKLVGLGDRIDSPVHQLSGGERQRVSVARAVAAQASVVFADEPTASLDGNSKRHISELLVDVLATNALVIVATHDREVAAKCVLQFDLVGGTLVPSETRA